MDLVFEVDEAGVLDVDEGLEDFADGYDAFADGDLAFAAGEVGEVLDVHVVEARACGVDGVDEVGVGAGGVAYVDAEADARVEILDGLEHVEGRGEELVFGAVVVDGDLDVVFLDEASRST